MNQRRHQRALSCSGWMSADELFWLQYAAAGRNLVIEFGSWCGRSSIALAAARNLVCCDTWQGSRDEPGHAELVQQFDPFAEFTKNIEPDFDHVTAVRGDLADPENQEALLSRYRGQADMVFVDACHAEEDVARDIRLARQLLCQRGLLCGHDYGVGWPGVTAAVEANVKGFVRGAGSIWAHAT